MPKFNNGDKVLLNNGGYGWDNDLIRIIGFGTNEVTQDLMYCIRVCSRIRIMTKDLPCWFVEKYGIKVDKNNGWPEILYGKG